MFHDLADLFRALAIQFQSSSFDTETDTTTETPNTPKLAEAVIETLQMLNAIRELRILNIKTLDHKTKASLRTASFNSIEILQIDAMPEAALLISACPNVTTLRSSFPCPKLKTTFKAIMDSQINSLELKNSKGWNPKQLAGRHTLPQSLHLTND